MKESGTTWPRACFCKRSSPMALAAFSASSISPGSSQSCRRWPWKAHTPARQSACSSWRTSRPVAPSTRSPRWRAALTKVARRAKALFQLAEERQVDIHPLIARAIEGPDRRVGEAAGGIDPVTEQHQGWVLVLPTGSLEDFPPGVFGVAEYGADELRLLVIGGRRGALRRADRTALHGLAGQLAENLHRVLATEQANDHHDGNAAQGQPLAAAHTAALAPCIHHVVAASSAFPAHLFIPVRVSLVEYCSGLAASVARVLAQHLILSLLVQAYHLVGLAHIAVFHARRAGRHARYGCAEQVRALAQFEDVRGGYMSLSTWSLTWKPLSSKWLIQALQQPQLGSRCTSMLSTSAAWVRPAKQQRSRAERRMVRILLRAGLSIARLPGAP